MYCTAADISSLSAAFNSSMTFALPFMVFSFEGTESLFGGDILSEVRHRA
jgi:hypothetical protein